MRGNVKGEEQGLRDKSKAEGEEERKEEEEQGKRQGEGGTLRGISPIFSRGHATLHLAMSVGRSVGPSHF